MLLGYDFTIEYRQSTKFGQADALSRLIGQQQSDKVAEDVVIGAIEVDVTAIHDECFQTIPVAHEQVQEATGSDPLLQEVLRYHSNSWPAKVKQGSPLCIILQPSRIPLGRSGMSHVRRTRGHSRGPQEHYST